MPMAADTVTALPPSPGETTAASTVKQHDGSFTKVDKTKLIDYLVRIIRYDYG
jgi:hypothetical protein